MAKNINGLVAAQAATQKKDFHNSVEEVKSMRTALAVLIEKNNFSQDMGEVLSRIPDWNSCIDADRKAVRQELLNVLTSGGIKTVLSSTEFTNFKSFLEGFRKLSNIVTLITGYYSRETKSTKKVAILIGGVKYYISAEKLADIKAAGTPAAETRSRLLQEATPANDEIEEF